MLMSHCCFVVCTKLASSVHPHTEPIFDESMAEYTAADVAVRYIVSIIIQVKFG